jgi:hypothetical protein
VTCSLLPYFTPAPNQRQALNNIYKKAATEEMYDMKKSYLLVPFEWTQAK